MGAPFIDVIGSSEVGSGALRRIYLPFFPLSTKRCIGKRFWGGPRVKVADEAGKSLPPGVPGRLMVRGKMLFSGYWNAHETILDAVADHWWWTGDVVCRDRFNRYFHLDRFVDRVVSDQGVLHTLEAEEKLLTHPAVHEAVVIGLPGKEGGGQVPIAVVSAMPGVELNPATLLAWANERHFSAQPLAKVVVVEYADIPRGLTGKVLKRQLRARYLLE